MKVKSCGPSRVKHKGGKKQKSRDKSFFVKWESVIKGLGKLKAKQ